MMYCTCDPRNKKFSPTCPYHKHLAPGVYRGDTDRSFALLVILTTATAILMLLYEVLK